MELAISVWDRCEGAGEVFLGQLIVVPPMHHGKIYDHWFNERVTGDIRLQLMYKSVEAKALCAEDFNTLKLVGKGSFGKVVLVRKKDTGRVFAMKILSKKHIIERQEIVHTLAERSVLIRGSKNPFLPSLKYSFQTPEKLYLVQDYMNGGELFYHLQREGAFTEAQAKFYTCELICALEFLHRNEIIYRDLKPENVLFDSNGHIILADFGLCKENFTRESKTNTFCGTAAYLAPEILLGEGYGLAVDWWALGILFYEMCTGLPPFYSENVNLMYKKILHNQLLFPIGTMKDAESFIRALLDRNSATRLGSGPTDALELKQHPYLASLDWTRLERKQLTPPFKPLVESETDTSNFDPFFTEDPTGVAPSLPSGASAPLSDTMQENFRGFTFESGGFAGSVQSSVGRF
ncbi:kinase-like domain-containing protein [Chytriomyces sp. MP71]|nr:kinase-like domain-containing protein [Chytriomyces sp. MP71]